MKKINKFLIFFSKNMVDLRFLRYNKNAFTVVRKGDDIGNVGNEEKNQGRYFSHGGALPSL